jgi:hypothetical protein
MLDMEDSSVNESTSCLYEELRAANLPAAVTPEPASRSNHLGWHQTPLWERSDSRQLVDPLGRKGEISVPELNAPVGSHRGLLEVLGPAKAHGDGFAQA